MTVGDYTQLANTEIHFNAPDEGENRWRSLLMTSFNIPLSAVPAAITEELLTRTVRIVAAELAAKSHFEQSLPELSRPFSRSADRVQSTSPCPAISYLTFRSQLPRHCFWSI